MELILQTRVEVDVHVTFRFAEGGLLPSEVGKVTHHVHVVVLTSLIFSFVLAPVSVDRGDVLVKRKHRVQLLKGPYIAIEPFR